MRDDLVEKCKVLSGAYQEAHQKTQVLLDKINDEIEVIYDKYDDELTKLESDEDIAWEGLLEAEEQLTDDELKEVHGGTTDPF